MRETICALRPPQKANKGQSRAIERLKKKMFENEFLLLLNSPTIPFRIHNRNGKVRKGWGRDRGGPFSWSRGCLFSRAPVHDLWDSGTQAQFARMLSQLLLDWGLPPPAGVEPVPPAGHHQHCHSCGWASGKGGSLPSSHLHQASGYMGRREPGMRLATWSLC